MTTLLKLAEHCEQATANEHVQLLRKAWDAIYGKAEPVAIDRWPGWRMPFRWDDFKAMVSAKAYESAAMTLVQEGWPRTKRVRYRPDGRVALSIFDENSLGQAAEAATETLALCAVALKAHAASAGEAGTAETTEIGSVHEHAVANGETPSHDPSNPQGRR